MKKLGVVAMALVLAGCAGVGNDSLRTESEATVSTKIVEGQTTKDQIRTMFGSPARTDFTEDGQEIWRYEFTKVSGDAVNYLPVVNLFGSSASGTKKELVVMFDTSNIVKRYSMSVSDVSQKTGLFNN
jgi:outer membrane protein assembly factor BamE (lipoprotein component of BamABCDE complex)